MDKKQRFFAILVTILLIGNISWVLCLDNKVQAVPNSTTITQRSNKDSYVSIENPEANYGSATKMRVNNTHNGGTRELSYIQFDISSVPFGANILSATLTLLCKASSNPNLVFVYRVLDTWTEHTITWNNKPHWYTSLFAPNTYVDTTGWYSWNVTQNVTDWHSGKYSNYGFALISNETGNHTSKFATKEYGCSSCRPKLEITYELNPPELSGIRTINPDIVIPGSSFIVEVDLAAYDFVTNPTLDENLPTGWAVTPLESSGFIINTSIDEWKFLGNWSSGFVATIMYQVNVPSNVDITTYLINGQVSGFNIGPYSTTGDSTVTVSHDWNTWDNDEIVTTLELQEIIDYWINDIPKNGHVISTTEFQVMINMWLSS